MIDHVVEHNLIRRVKSGDDDALVKLIEMHRGFLCKMAYKYGHDVGDIEEAKMAGEEGVWEAAKRFDFERGIKFIGYAGYWIRKSIIQRRMTSRSKINQITIRESDMLGRSRGEEEIAGIGRKSAIECSPTEGIELADDLRLVNTVMHQELSPSDILIVSMRVNGKKWSEIASEIGITHQGAQKRFKRSIAKLKDRIKHVGASRQTIIPVCLTIPCESPIAIPGKLRVWTPQEDEFLREHKERGWIWCAKQLRVSVHAVRCRARRIGVRKKKRLSSVDLATAKTLLAEGRSTREVGNILGVSTECIRSNAVKNQWQRAWKRDETERMRIFEERYGSRSATKIRSMRRAAELGRPNMPAPVATVLAAAERVEPRADKYRLHQECVRIFDEQRWSSPPSPQAVYSAARAAVSMGLMEMHKDYKTSIARFSLKKNTGCPSCEH